MRIIFLLLVVTLVAACTNKQMYQSGIQNQKSRCIKQAKSESQLIQCEQEAKAQPSYEEYNKQRDEVIKRT